VLKFLIVFLLTAMASNSLAQSAAEYEYDPDNGSDINELCAGCHGEFGEGGGDGEYPRLAGMPYKYLVNQMLDFQDGKRPSIAMAMYATERELPGNDLRDISRYLSEKELMTHMPKVDEDLPALEKLRIASRVFNVFRYEGDFTQGKVIYRGQCAKCHGAEGQGKGATPRLAGQYTDYLRLQIDSFRQGVRHSSQMEKYLKPLSPADIEALLAYLSILDD